MVTGKMPAGIRDDITQCIGRTPLVRLRRVCQSNVDRPFELNVSAAGLVVADSHGVPFSVVFDEARTFNSCCRYAKSQWLPNICRCAFTDKL